MKTKKNSIDYKHGIFTIMTTEIDTDGFDRTDYEEWCEDMGIDPGDDSDFFDWCAEETQTNYEADMENIKSCKQYNVPCIVTGSLGLWDGRHEIRAKRFESVYDAVMACMGDFDNTTVARYEDGRIGVTVSHHDGRNCFEIVALSKKGIEKVGENYAKHDTKRLPYLYAI